MINNQIKKEILNNNNRVYALIDPLKESNEEEEVFYIGITTRKDYKNRLYCHIYDSVHYKNKNVYKERKIRKIIELGSKPDIKILEENIDSYDCLKERERYWIAYYRELYGERNICNISDGGDWNPVIEADNKEEIRQKISNTKKRLFEEKVLSMGYSSVEEYKRIKKETDKENRKKWYKDNKEHRAELARNYRNKQREDIGDEEFRKNVSKSKRDYISSMSEEEYKRYKDRENEYWRNRRKNETEEERKERLLKASIWRKQRALNETVEEREKRLQKRRDDKALSKQKKIDKLGIEEYNRIESNRSKRYLDSLSKDKRREIYDRNNAYQRNIILTESKEERELRLKKKQEQRGRNKDGKEKNKMERSIRIKEAVC